MGTIALKFSSNIYRLAMILKHNTLFDLFLKKKIYIYKN